ncbi:vanadium-dependent haloperoxidase [Lewinella sp. JB7]|uniref:vanadium-dependent haloperoxidase n=1 Tax=Lewinella sp. JB7 TaxID=2962887 RepID=UPI0020CA2039|nr:vanadium-dependent haloperoxidase [Lewinella sp. JB7]MCP9235246.1 vanadium-dependent haloperoxidase [Lewinella sp. JB7]
MSTPFLFFFLCCLVLVSCTEDEELSLLEVPEADESPITGVTNGDRNATNLSPDIVREWTDVLLQNERHAVGLRPNGSARALAYIYLAAYETALPALRGFTSNTRRLDGLNLERDFRGADNASVALALNACFADVINHFLINVPAELQDDVDDFELAMRDELTRGLSDRAIAEAEDWGAYVARQVIEYSQTDREAEEQILDPQPRSYEPPVGEGFWTYSADPERALFPYWERVRTFVIPAEETTTLPPLAYSTVAGSPFREQMEEVYAVNNAARGRDDEQLWIAEFWSDDVERLMISPPARQISIANQLADQYSLSLGESLALFLRVGFAMNDAAVATWKYKYAHMVMRPSVYLQDLIDPEFRTNLFRLIFWPDPGFPGYPSGHSCFASAAGGVFRETFGNQTNFTDRTHEGRTEFRGAPRTYSTFDQLAEENAYSRIPLGVHVRMDCDEGLRLGYEIAGAVNDLTLREEDF